MAVTAKKSKAQILAELEEDRPDEIAEAEVVRGASTKPVSFRASSPLLAALDRVAEKDRRTRANLIQYVLWQYIHENSDPLIPGKARKLG